MKRECLFYRVYACIAMQFTDGGLTRVVVFPKLSLLSLSTFILIELLLHRSPEWPLHVTQHWFYPSRDRFVKSRPLKKD